MIRYLIPFLFLGCTTEESTQEEILLPIMELSKKNIDFGDVEWGSTEAKILYVENQGELPMGLKPIVILDEGFEDNFSFSYDTETIQCISGYEESESEREPNLSEEEFILNPGCRLKIDILYSPASVGAAFAALEIESIIEDTEVFADTTPQFYRDPSDFKQLVFLEASSRQDVGNIFVTPRIVDFGHHWMSESDTRQIKLQNVGNGPLEVETPYIEDCDEAFSIDLALLDGDRTISAGDGSLFEVNFNPVDLETAYCTVIIPSNDPETSEIEVTLKGNAGIDPSNTAPSLQLISPAPGYIHNTDEDLVLELAMFDINQPADTLICRVRSMVLQGPGHICQAEDAGGYTRVSIPIENLTRGLDTLLVTVIDQSELQASASTSILYGDVHVDSDDDGDGFGDGIHDEFFDCDDTDPLIYPYAAEIPDGKDNDCDGGIDERTISSDDDGDSVSEEEGDCNDNDKNTYPGAPELPDLSDNDCDGIIDENTSLSDDDGDGFSELDNDCNDRDDSINPSAIEYCDNIDNNCNNLRDEQEEEGCIAIDSAPVIIGGIEMADRAIGAGESTTMTVFVYDAEGDELSFNWGEDPVMASLDHTAITAPTARTITWTAPELPSSLDGQLFKVIVEVTDENGNQDWVFGDIAVYSRPVTDSLVYETTTGSSCGGSTAAGVFLPLLSLAFLRRRRKNT